MPPLVMYCFKDNVASLEEPYVEARDYFDRRIS